MRLLVLVTDAFGGRGGIAKFNRDMLTAMCDHSAVTGVVALPRVITEGYEGTPAKLVFCRQAARGKFAYLRSFARYVLRPGRGSEDQQGSENSFTGVVCAHIHLLPLAYLAAKLFRVPLVLVVHGIEAWQPTRRKFVSCLVSRVDYFISVSEFTKTRFLGWTTLRNEQGRVIPNGVDISRFGIEERRADLISQYGLADARVIMTLGRLSAAEQYKGFDEVMDVLPDLAREIPSLRYLIAGDGPDRARLQARARSLDVADRVVFTGYVPESEKADHYRLADAFVMPGRGEGFGIVYLEALACGVPIVASTADASQEVAMNGMLGELADPDDPESIQAAIVRALARRREVPEALWRFSVQQFRERWHSALDVAFGNRSPSAVVPALTDMQTNVARASR